MVMFTLIPTLACQSNETQPAQNQKVAPKNEGPTPTPSPTPTPTPVGQVDVKDIVNNTGLKIVQDPHQANHFYLLPPEKVIVEAEFYGTPSANWGFCDGISISQQLLNEEYLKSKILASEIEQSNDSLTIVKNQIESQKLKLDALLTSNDLVRKYEDFEKTINFISVHISAYEILLKYCENRKCRKENEGQIRELSKELLDLQVQQKDFFTENQKQLQEYADLKADFKNSLELVKKLALELEIKKEDLDRRLALRNALTASESKTTAGVFKFFAYSHWDEKLKQIIKENPKYLQFDYVPMKEVKVKIDPIDEDGEVVLQGVDTVLAYEFNGIRGQGEVRLNGLDHIGLTGWLNLNLLGGCPLLYPDDFKVKKTPNGKYPLQMLFQYQLAL